MLHALSLGFAFCVVRDADDATTTNAVTPAQPFLYANANPPTLTTISPGYHQQQQQPPILFLQPPPGSV